MTTWFDEQKQLKALWQSVKDDEEELNDFFPGGEDDYKCRRVRTCQTCALSDFE